MLLLGKHEINMLPPSASRPQHLSNKESGAGSCISKVREEMFTKETT